MTSPENIAHESRIRGIKLRLYDGRLTSWQQLHDDTEWLLSELARVRDSERVAIQTSYENAKLHMQVMRERDEIAERLRAYEPEGVEEPIPPDLREMD